MIDPKDDLNDGPILKLKDSITAKIQTDLINPSYYDDVEYNIYGKSQCKLLGDVFEAIAQISIGVCTILTFAAGVYNINTLSFVAGAIGVVSLVFFRLSSYAMRESKERTEQINRILEKLKMDTIPDIVIDSSMDKT